MKARYLFAIAIICSIISILGLRANAQRSIALKNQIIQNDLKGQKVSEEINTLRKFVFSHMNASAEFELIGSYEQDVVSAQQSGVNSSTYRRAQAACDREGVSSVEQARCVQSYLSSRIDNSASPNLPQRNRYVYAFVSPAWRPDLAGLAMLGAIIFFISAAVTYILSQFRTRRGQI